MFRQCVCLTTTCLYRHFRSPIGHYCRIVNILPLRPTWFRLVACVIVFSPACHLSLHHTSEPSCKPQLPSYTSAGGQKQNTPHHLKSFAKVKLILPYRLLDENTCCTTLFKRVVQREFSLKRIPPIIYRLNSSRVTVPNFDTACAYNH